MIQPSLPDLQEHISRFQAELRQMRQQFSARKTKLAALINRRGELLTQLQQVETEMADQIAALAQEEPPLSPSTSQAVAAAMPKASALSAKAVPSKAAHKPNGRSNGMTAKAPNASPEPMSLRSHVTVILKATKKPISSAELAKRVLKAGYKTSSKNFTNVIAAQLSKMNNIEYVKGEGYQLMG